MESRSNIQTTARNNRKLEEAKKRAAQLLNISYSSWYGKRKNKHLMERKYAYENVRFRNGP